MCRMVRWFALIVLFAGRLSAQTPGSLAGHWEGQVQAPGASPFEMDIVRTSAGGFSGTVTIAKEGLRGLPLTIAMTGETVSVFSRTDQKFQGTLSADGREVTGKYALGTFSFPFTMTRTGEARMEATPPIPAVSRQLEGVWQGTLDAPKTTLRLLLTLSNRPDGTAVGKINNIDQGNLEIPVAGIAQRARDVVLDLKAISGSYSGTLSEDGTTLTGIYRQGTESAPLTFHRATQ